MPLLARPGVVQVIKYVVYLSLLINFVVYIHDDYLAWQSSLPPGAPIGAILTTFSTSIDMAAWVGLIFLFELETYALPESAFTRWIISAMRLGRTLCYVGILYAAFGYSIEAMKNYRVTEIPNINNACQMAGQELHMQMNSIEYQEITKDNCSLISSATVFYRIDKNVSVIDRTKLEHVQWMGWLDICNAFTWIFVVLLIEVEIWMQNRDRFRGRVLDAARQTKTFLYLVLIANAFAWFITDYYIYTWDAFLWIFGFWVIELNLAEWEIGRLQEIST